MGARRPPASATIVVPARNAVATLPAQLAALSTQTAPVPWDVVIADNGSTDATLEYLGGAGRQYPWLRVVDASERTGSYYARNVGASAATGELLVFCDADDHVLPGWLDAIIAAAADADLVGGALVSPGSSAPVRGLNTADLGFLPYAFTANLAVWRDVFHLLGGWDDSLLNGGDADFCWRAQLAGYTLAFAPTARVDYRARPSLAALARQYYRYSFVQPRLYRRFRAHGLRRRPLIDVGRNWLGCVARVPTLPFADRGDLAQWVVRTSTLAGRAAGSVRWRSVFL